MDEDIEKIVDMTGTLRSILEEAISYYSEKGFNEKEVVSGLMSAHCTILAEFAGVESAARYMATAASLMGDIINIKPAEGENVH